MQITLDGEQWAVTDELTLMEVLAEVSDRAHQRKRVVVSLTVGGKAMTDRDLIPGLLNSPVKTLGPVQATTQSLHGIVSGAKASIKKFAAELHADGQSLVHPFRSGAGRIGTIDAWLGRLADYTELLETGATEGVVGLTSSQLAPWIQELLNARSTGDAVRMADLLEYEILPRLIERNVAA